MTALESLTPADARGLTLLADLYTSTIFTQRRVSMAIGAAVGDSITAQGTGGSRESTTFFNNGYVTWLRILSKGRIRIPTENVIAIGGSTPAQIKGFVAQAIAIRPKVDFILINAGANLGSSTDPAISTTAAEMAAMCIEAGIVPWFSLPLGSNAAIGDGGAIKQSGYSNFLRALGRGDEWAVQLVGAADSRLLPLVTDPSRLMLDTTSTTQHIVLPINGDLHPGGTGAYHTALCQWETVKHMFAPRYATIDPGDRYHVTDNPRGNMLPATVNCMSGAGGSHNTGYSNAVADGSVATQLGPVPTGISIMRGPGSGSDLTITTSKVGIAGHISASALRVVVDVTKAGSGGGDKIMIHADTNLAELGLVAGDQIEFECFYRTTGNMAKVRSIGVEFVQDGGQQGEDGKQSGGPSASAAGTAYPQEAHEGALRPPKITITNTQSPRVDFLIYIENDAAGGHVEVETWGWAIRKVL